jgi:dimethylglycine dehydrogenase
MAFRSTGHELWWKTNDGGSEEHSINLYKELADHTEFDQLPSWRRRHPAGPTPVTDEGYRHFASMARGMDVDLEVIDAEECARRPLISNR